MDWKTERLERLPVDFHPTHQLIGFFNKRKGTTLFRPVFPECFRAALTLSCLLDCLWSGQARLYGIIKHWTSECCNHHPGKLAAKTHTHT